MALEYSERAMLAYSEFYRSFNEKTIYVEDSKGRLLHERVLSAIIGPGRIKRIFPLGGRIKVLEEWSKNRDNKDNIYVIDGDLDVIKGTRQQTENLYQLEVYSVENFFVAEECLRCVIEDYVEEQDTDRFIFKVSNLMEDCLPAFARLYVLYAIAHSCGGGIDTVSDGVFRYMNGDNVSKKRVNQKIRELIKFILGKMDRAEYIRTKMEIRDHIVRNNISAIHFISGKSVIVPLKHKFAHRHGNYSGKVSVFVNQLSRYFEASMAPEYSTFLRSRFE